jgi:VIT1/CCC1 family predicted Fe2+/Mn2+ transporter
MSKEEPQEITLEEIKPELPSVPPKAEEKNWANVVKVFLEKNPNFVHEIADAITIAIRGRPETVKAEISLKKWTMGAFVVLIGVMLGITTYLAVLDKLSGDTVAFIFGTAFGSIIGFLYRFLSGKE